MRLMVRADLYGEVFNIGSAEEIAILDLRERVREAVDSASGASLISYLTRILDDVIRSEREGGIDFSSSGSADLAAMAVQGSELD